MRTIHERERREPSIVRVPSERMKNGRKSKHAESRRAALVETRGKRSETRRPRLTSPPSVQMSFASFLRVSDNVLTRLVKLYDDLFVLDREEECRICLELGRQMVVDGRVDDALRLYRKATVVKPDEPEGWVALADIYLARKAPKAAINAIDKAMELGVESAKLHRACAEALVQVEELDEAVAELERGLALDPDYHPCWFELGAIRDTRGEHEQAVEAFERALELAPDKILYHQRLGFALEGLGRRKEAIQCFKKALKLEYAKKLRL